MPHCLQACEPRCSKCGIQKRRSARVRRWLAWAMAIQTVCPIGEGGRRGRRRVGAQGPGGARGHIPPPEGAHAPAPQAPNPIHRVHRATAEWHTRSGGPRHRRPAPARWDTCDARPEAEGGAEGATVPRCCEGGPPGPLGCTVTAVRDRCPMSRTSGRRMVGLGRLRRRGTGQHQTCRQCLPAHT